VPRILDLRLQYLRAGDISFCQMLVFNQLLGANFVRDSQVTLRKAALDDRLDCLSNFCGLRGQTRGPHLSKSDLSPSH
jgi:hypothetical protein